MSDNGIVSFDLPFLFYIPTPLPTSSSVIRKKFFVAPYWADVDLRSEGDVRYQTFEITSEDEEETQQLQAVNDYISAEENIDFTGIWMLLVEWDGVHPFPQGGDQPQVNDDAHAYLQLVRIVTECVKKSLDFSCILMPMSSWWLSACV